MVSRRIDAIDTVRLLLPILHQDLRIVAQADFDAIRGIDSQTDHLTVGRVRQHWHPDFPPQKAAEIARCDELYPELVRAICERILTRIQRVQ